MAKGGQTTTQTAIQDVPEWMKGYYTGTPDDPFGLLPAAAGLAQEEYTPYTGPRVVSDAQDITTSQGMIRDIAGQGIPGLDEAQGIMGGLGAMAGRLGQQQPSPFTAAQFGASAAAPYAGFNASAATPYAGFEANVGDVFTGFREGQAVPFSEFAAGQATPFSEFQAGQADAFQFDPARQFGGAEAQQYMDPYMQSVVSRQQDDAVEQFRRQQAERSAGAVQAGAFGGSRQAVQEGIAEEALGRQLGDIQATGSQRAFEQAQQQFERDRAAQTSQQAAQAEELARVQGIGIDEARRVQEARAAELARTQGIGIDEASRVQQARAAELARVQGVNIGESSRVQEARAAELARVQGMTADEFARVQSTQAAEIARAQGISVDEAARVQQARAAELARTQGISVDEAARVQAAQAAEQGRVQGATADEAMRQREFQLQTMGFSADMASEIANLGERARAGDIQAAQLLEAQGLGQMARDQAGLDVGYEDFLRQQNFPRQQLADYAAILQGLPIGDAGTTTTMQPYNPMQQALGAGISAAGLYNAMGG